MRIVIIVIIIIIIIIWLVLYANYILLRAM